MELEVKIDHCSETIRKIKALEICPVCEQKVDDKHKHDIYSREDEKHQELFGQAILYKEKKSKLDGDKIELKKVLGLLIKEQNHYNILKVKMENLNEKLIEKDEKIKLKDRVKKDISLLNTKKAELNLQINKHYEVEEKYKKIKKEIDDLMPQERFLELEKRKYESEKESIRRFILNLETDINEKQKAKEKLIYISQLNNWIDEFFVNLILTMEKHVMVSVHSQFDGLFKNWFSILLEDETISIRVDEEFTPIIEQDGYETYIENLSGGEKTSVALSYRLALNKVINEVIVGVKTKDIIMLDEPTDGFSSEQLDKVRDVLEQLNMKQVIIVSHESKIEGFVENVIRLQKQDNISVVL